MPVYSLFYRGFRRFIPVNSRLFLVYSCYKPLKTPYNLLLNPINLSELLIYCYSRVIPVIPSSVSYSLFIRGFTGVGRGKRSGEQCGTVRNREENP